MDHVFLRLMDFFGFETDFESFLAHLFTAVQSYYNDNPGHGQDDPRSQDVVRRTPPNDLPKHISND